MSVSDAELADALGDAWGAPVRVERRRPLASRSTFPIERVEAELAGGGSRAVVFKAFPSTPPPAKPGWLYDPAREIELYRSALGDRGEGPPRCVGAVQDPGRGRHWLFLEPARGDPLWQIGDLGAWEAAAAWLARLHAGGPPPATTRGVRYDGAYLRRWPARAAAATGPGPLDRLAGRYEPVVERLVAQPATFVHGDAYPSNVLVESRDGRPRLHVLDWELGGTGPGVLDLAALSAGSWSEDARERIVAAYVRASAPLADEDEFRTALTCARLHVALQWLGWSPTWTPPPEHRHDWLGDAVACMEGLGL